jgi:hypothetical protein
MLAGKRFATGLCLSGALACAAPVEPPAPGHAADYDAPRPALAASFVRVSLHREGRGDLDGALRAAEQALVAGPASGAAALREAEAQAALARRDGDAGSLAEARGAILALREEHPEEPALRIAAARIALLQGQEEEAASEARALLEARPDWAAPHTLLSEALRDEDPAASLAEAERAVALAPSDPDALAARARARSALADDAGAADDARRSLRVRHDPSLETVVVRELLRRGELARAIARAEGVLEGERSPELERLLAEAHAAQGGQEAARTAIARARARAAGDPEADDQALAVGTSLAIRSDRAGEALAEIEEARAGRADDGRLFELAAHCQLALGLLPAAEASARRAVELRGAPESFAILAAVLEASGARPPALERARVALGAGAEDARAETLAGFVAEDAGEAAAAAVSYEAALARDASASAAQLRLAALLTAEGRDLARAVELAEAARHALGWTRDTAETLARALRASGRVTDAVVPYRIAWAKLAPGEAGTEALMLELAETLEAAGQREEALGLASTLTTRKLKDDAEPAWLPRARELRQQILAEAAPPASAP